MAFLSWRGGWFAVLSVGLMACFSWGGARCAAAGVQDSADWQELLQQAQAWDKDASDETRQTFLKNFKTCFSQDITPDDIRLAEEIGNQLVAAGDRSTAAQTLELAGELASQSTDKKIARYAKVFTGSARRVRLVGNEMKLDGTYLDGTKFDWAPYQGKVVIVEFWATWCKPCILVDLPKIQEEYRLYHDKGLEVIGVCLDFEADAAKKFLKEKEVPWPQIYESIEQRTSNDFTVSGYYGVNSIPCKVLIGKDGKVLAVNPKDLPKELEKLLGPVTGRKPWMTPEEESQMLLRAYGLIPSGEPSKDEASDPKDKAAEDKAEDDKND